MEDYFCGLCGEPTSDNAIRAFEDDPGSAFHYGCAEKIADAHSAQWVGNKIGLKERKLLRRLIDGVRLCGESDADTSDFVIWLACEGDDIVEAIRMVLDTVEGEAVEEGPREEVSLVWKLRQMQDELHATTDLARKVRAVWELWLTDAQRGAISPATFDAMKVILGIGKT